MKVRQYSVVVLLNGDGSKVLLQVKDRTIFAGKLNGVGGKIEYHEEPAKGAMREIKEETTLTEDDIEDFTWLGNLVVPEACDDSNTIPELIFYSGKVKEEHKAHKAPDATEEVGWYELDNNNIPVTHIELAGKIMSMELAGNGDLPYFIGTARRLLFGKTSVDSK